MRQHHRIDIPWIEVETLILQALHRITALMHAAIKQYGFAMHGYMVTGTGHLASCPVGRYRNS